MYGHQSKYSIPLRTYRRIQAQARRNGGIWFTIMLIFSCWGGFLNNSLYSVYDSLVISLLASSRT